MNKEDDTKTLYSQIILPTVVFNLKADSVNWTFAVDKSRSESYFARFLDHNKVNLWNSIYSFVNLLLKLVKYHKIHWKNCLIL